MIKKCIYTFLHELLSHFKRWTISIQFGYIDSVYVKCILQMKTSRACLLYHHHHHKCCLCPHHHKWCLCPQRRHTSPNAAYVPTTTIYRRQFCVGLHHRTPPLCMLPPPTPVMLSMPLYNNQHYQWCLRSHHHHISVYAPTPPSMLPVPPSQPLNDMSALHHHHHHQCCLIPLPTTTTTTPRPLSIGHHPPPPSLCSLSSTNFTLFIQWFN